MCCTDFTLRLDPDKICSLVDTILETDLITTQCTDNVANKTLIIYSTILVRCCLKMSTKI